MTDNSVHANYSLNSPLNVESSPISPLNPSLDASLDPVLDPALDPTLDPALDPVLDPTLDLPLDSTFNVSTIHQSHQKHFSNTIYDTNDDLVDSMHENYKYQQNNYFQDESFSENDTQNVSNMEASGEDSSRSAYRFLNNQTPLFRPVSSRRNVIDGEQSMLSLHSIDSLAGTRLINAESNDVSFDTTPRTDQQLDVSTQAQDAVEQPMNPSEGDTSLNTPLDAPFEMPLNESSDLNRNDSIEFSMGLRVEASQNDSPPHYSTPSEMINGISSDFVNNVTGEVMNEFTNETNKRVTQDADQELMENLNHEKMKTQEVEDVDHPETTSNNEAHQIKSPRSNSPRSNSPRSLSSRSNSPRSQISNPSGSPSRNVERSLTNSPTNILSSSPTNILSSSPTNSLTNSPIRSPKRSPVSSPRVGSRMSSQSSISDMENDAPIDERTNEAVFNLIDENMDRKPIVNANATSDSEGSVVGNPMGEKNPIPPVSEDENSMGSNQENENPSVEIDMIPSPIRSFESHARSPPKRFSYTLERVSPTHSQDTSTPPFSSYHENRSAESHTMKPLQHDPLNSQEKKASEPSSSRSMESSQNLASISNQQQPNEQETSSSSNEEFVNPIVIPKALLNEDYPDLFEKELQRRLSIINLAVEGHVSREGIPMQDYLIPPSPFKKDSNDDVIPEEFKSPIMKMPEYKSNSHDEDEMNDDTHGRNSHKDGSHQIDSHKSLEESFIASTPRKRVSHPFALESPIDSTFSQWTQLPPLFHHRTCLLLDVQSKRTEDGIINSLDAILFVTGGESTSNPWTNSIYIHPLSIMEDGRVNIIAKNPSPSTKLLYFDTSTFPARDSHGLILWNNHLVFIGGNVGVPDSKGCDVYKIDLEHFSVNRITFKKDDPSTRTNYHSNITTFGSFSPSSQMQSQYHTYSTSQSLASSPNRDPFIESDFIHQNMKREEMGYGKSLSSLASEPSNRTLLVNTKLPLICRRLHTVTYIGDDKVLMVGGTAIETYRPLFSPKISNPETPTILRDAWIFDLKHQYWTEAAPPPEHISGHTAVYDSINERVIVFGGINHASERMNDIFLYDPQKNEWEVLRDVKGAIPTPRMEHAACYNTTRQSMIIYGGWTGTGPRADCFSFSLETRTWKRLAVSTERKRAPRFGHSCEMIDDILVVYGGKNDSFEILDTFETIHPWEYNREGMQSSMLLDTSQSLDQSYHQSHHTPSRLSQDSSFAISHSYHSLGIISTKLEAMKESYLFVGKHARKEFLERTQSKPPIQVPIIDKRSYSREQDPVAQGSTESGTGLADRDSFHGNDDVSDGSFFTPSRERGDSTPRMMNDNASKSLTATQSRGIAQLNSLLEEDL